MSDSRTRSILWIEDVPEEVAGTRMSLERNGHDVVTVAGAAKAAESLRARHFDLLLVDEMLAEDGHSPASGSRVVEQLQAGDLGVTNAGIPFAVVTAYRGLVDSDAMAAMPGYQGVFSKTGSLTEDLVKALAGLITVPGLVDSEGNPLNGDSPAGRDVVVGVRSVYAELVDVLAEEPRLLHALDPREFEELIAELFARNGFEVDLTSRTGDRGADLYAVRQTGLGKLRYVIECKRNSPRNRVGPKLVRELRGVVDRERTTCGVLVTTSTFTPGAREEQQTTPYQLSLRDFEHVASWLRGRPIFD